jgi:hypothetical protein
VHGGHNTLWPSLGPLTPSPPPHLPLPLYHLICHYLSTTSFAITSTPSHLPFHLPSHLPSPLHHLICHLICRYLSNTSFAITSPPSQLPSHLPSPLHLICHYLSTISFIISFAVTSHLHCTACLAGRVQRAFQSRIGFDKERPSST